MQPVEYVGVSAAVVAGFEALDQAAQSAAFWSDETVGPVKSVIKTHYIVEQQRRCCYCARDLGTSHHGVWDCEHIIARVTRPQWMFTPHNLAAACKDCNLAKSDDPVLKNRNRVTFPKKSGDYLIVHPHFDNYEDHIRWTGTVPRPNGSVKGKNTIIMCDLLRFSAQEAAMPSSPGDRRFDALVGDLMKRPGPHDAAMILAALAAALNAAPAQPPPAALAQDPPAD